jgi:hypothetical protein
MFFKEPAVPGSGPRQAGNPLFFFVIPVKTGIQDKKLSMTIFSPSVLDPGFRRGDET